MANDYARVMRSIWGDDDFRELPQDSQWLYFHLLTSPSLNHAGVTDWRPARIAGLARGLTADAVEAASVELEGNLYTLVDRDSEEAMIRTFIRHDGLMQQPNMAAAMAKAHSGISSKILRGVIVHELKHLKEDQPDLNGWSRPGVKLILRRTSITPSEAFDQLPRYGFINPSVKGSVKGSVNPSDSDRLTPPERGPERGASLLTPSPTPSPSPQHSGSDTYLSTEGTADSDSAQHLKVVNV
jgi:hypothetical protein